MFVATCDTGGEFDVDGGIYVMVLGGGGGGEVWLVVLLCLDLAVVFTAGGLAVYICLGLGCG